MNRILVSQNSQCRCHTDTVVSTQRRAVSRHPFAVVLYIGLNGIFLKIKHFIAVLLRHHVHVSLQNNARMVLHACTRRLTNQHIADLVLQRLQTKALAVTNQEVCDLFTFTARTRNLRKAVETVPQTFGF